MIGDYHGLSISSSGGRADGDSEFYAFIQVGAVDIIDLSLRKVSLLIKID